MRDHCIDMDVAGVVASFNSCIVKARKGNKHGCKEDIHIGRFIQAFHDLLPILRLLGTAFYFVEQDIVQKLTAIASNQEKQKDSEHSRYLIDFISWEKESNPKMLHDKHTSARHTLRLMRALHFISVRIIPYPNPYTWLQLKFPNRTPCLIFSHPDPVPICLSTDGNH